MGQQDLLQGLNDYLAKRRISHKNLAKALGVSPGTLGQWLQGHRKLRRDECDRLENFLKKDKPSENKP